MDDISLELSIKDESHLFKFIKNINGNQNLTYRERKKNKYVLLRISSRKFCKQLNDIGCVPNKSNTVRYPKLDSKLNRHFIRGVFDGDGCCSSINKNTGRAFSIYSNSLEFISEIKDIMERETGITLSLGRNNKQISTYKKNNILKIRKYFYDDALIFLDRKKGKFNL